MRNVMFHVCKKVPIFKPDKLHGKSLDLCYGWQILVSILIRISIKTRIVNVFIRSESTISVLNFVIFQKRGFGIINVNLSNTTKLILLDSLLEEVTAPKI